MQVVQSSLGSKLCDSSLHLRDVSCHAVGKQQHPVTDQLDSSLRGDEDKVSHTNMSCGAVEKHLIMTYRPVHTVVASRTGRTCSGGEQDIDVCRMASFAHTSSSGEEAKDSMAEINVIILDSEEDKGQVALGEEDKGIVALGEEEDKGIVALGEEEDKGQVALGEEEDKGIVALGEEEDKGQVALGEEEDKGQVALGEEEDKGQVALGEEEDKGQVL